TKHTNGIKGCLFAGDRAGALAAANAHYASLPDGAPTAANSAAPGQAGAGTKDTPGHVNPWWQVKQPFHAASGNNHTLFFHGEGANAKLYMASEPRSLEDVLRDKDLSIEDKATLEAGLNAIKTKIASNPGIGQKPD